jgi:hypothetical protein
MNPGFEEYQRVRERVREEVEWTGERAEVDMEKTGYLNLLCRE